MNEKKERVITYPVSCGLYSSLQFFRVSVSLFHPLSLYSSSLVHSFFFHLSPFFLLQLIRMFWQTGGECGCEDRKHTVYNNIDSWLRVRIANMLQEKQVITIINQLIIMIIKSIHYY